MLTRNATPRARQGGFTLVELLIAMVLMGIIGGAIVTLLLRQQRFYNSTNDLIQTRQQIRQAAAMLPADLRGISSVGGDIYVMTDSSIEFRSVFGSSVACTVDGAGGWVSTVPQALLKGSAITNWAYLPSVNDSVAVYSDGIATAAADDFWTVTQITAVLARTGGASDGCPVTSGMVQNIAADLAATNPSYKLTILPKVPTVSPGASLRFFRRVHYSLYKAADNLWYLGYYDCKTARVPVCNTIQPIGGPFQAYANDGTSGLQFTYYDSTGVVTATRANVARISLAVRGQGTSLVSFSGVKGGATFRDSLRMEINLRNKK
jgi:prepilin-type N-terminal cleavage/methylation domain-containing protein